MLASQLVVNLPKFVSGISSWFPDLFSYISVCMYVCMYVCVPLFMFLFLHGLIIILSVSVFIVYFMLSVVSY